MAVVKVQRENVVLNIDESQVESYKLQGYDVIDNDGKVLDKATGGRTVSIEEHNKVVAELEELQNADPSKVGEPDAKVADLQEELALAREEIKVLETENDRLDKQVKSYKNNNNRK